ncbi:Kelch repeat type 1 and BTB/Kelch-associated domain and Kelch-type beta propeller domain-containing protein [Strongyloides ratti]|uniref:Kelch repeat type 1 and BTB/Kelch-associated domain and Kelch-type beta propeller domain-containing protein n=1 Tax=Strongyloides ratti TaxID=34506 RepID=A0A090MRS0_STRRB|nr:Kelch repeat type 1 and BTB/Kelch-associated domain and Kelch-type beta propeller domain-containing protein [Strongyloides ratti]CEF60943.1 Kelch repeat type 1 and BTB/Kelch-associated domain and Kelch-type beta propeller domain-containing protein [Strongyloides ratti]
MEKIEKGRLAKYIFRHFDKLSDLKKIILIEELRKKIYCDTIPDKCLLNLRYEQLLSVLTNDMIKSFDQKIWIDFLFNWIEYKGNQRLDILGKILRNLPYKTMSQEFIKEHIIQKNRIQNDKHHKIFMYSILCIKMNGIKISKEKINLLQDSLKESYIAAEKEEYTTYFQDIFDKKNHYNTLEYEDEIQKLINHFSNTQKDANNQKEVITKEFIEKNKNTPLKYDVEKVFVFQDVFESNQIIKNFTFNPYDKKFSPISYMNDDTRTRSSSLIINKKIFLINGYNDCTTKGTNKDYVNCYDITKNLWEKNVFNTKTKTRYNSLIVKVPSNDYQGYQIGGIYEDGDIPGEIKLYNFENLKVYTSFDITSYNLCNIQNGIFIDNAYYLFEHKSQFNHNSMIIRWDPRESFSNCTFVNFNILNNLQSSYSLVNYDKAIFMLGGKDKKGQPLDDVKLFDVRNFKINTLLKMPSKRYNHCCFVYKTDIYVLGGITNNKNEDKNIDIFDIKTFKWTISGTKLPISMNSFTSAYYQT